MQGAIILDSRRQALMALWAVLEALQWPSVDHATHRDGHGSANAGFKTNGNHYVCQFGFDAVLPLIPLLAVATASGFATVSNELDYLM